MKKKVDEIKAEMGFEKQSPRCDNCKHAKGDISAWNPDKLINMRCMVGDFAVRPMNWCKRYERKE